MSGLVGIISKSSPQKNEADLGIMLNVMSYENFYSTGSYSSDEIGFYGGWVCHKDSFCDCLPIWNEKQNMVLLFFGENFTDRELFNKLKAKNHRFESSNASYILHMYEEKGMDFLQDLNGWFCGLLIDLQNHKIVLFNDRYGMQRIYYYEGKDAFYFASEAKSLLRICPELRALDVQGMGELLCFGATLENRTLYQYIFILPPASAWIFQNNGMNKTKYFEPTIWENQSWLESDFFYEKLQDTLKAILPRYFRTDQQIGISLTGGVDTRIILANMDMSAGKYPCYTFGGMYRDCYDVKFARKVAAAIGQTHKSVTIDHSFLNNFADYAERTIYISDGYFDVSGSPELYANKLAREIAPIRMTGNLGGEILRNISWQLNNQLHGEHFSSDFKKVNSKIKETAGKVKRDIDTPLSFQLFITTPYLETCRLSIAQSQLTMRSPYMDNDLVSLMYRAPLGARDSKEISLRLIRDGNPVLGKITTDRGLGGDLLFPTSKLVQLYYEFLAKTEYAYNYGMPQWLAHIDYTLKFMHFEKLFLGRHKFYHFRLWYRDELAEYVKAILLDDRTLSRPYLNRNAVEQIVEGHTKGYRNYTHEITQLLTIELIQRLLIEQQ